MKFLTEQKTMYLRQLGFRKNFSTAHAIINLIDSTKNAIDQNNFVWRVFMKGTTRNYKGNSKNQKGTSEK